MDQSILTQALYLAKMDLPIFPCCDVAHSGNINLDRHAPQCRCAGKTPLIKWRDRTHTTAQEVIAWRDQFGEYNIGMAMGSVSGYIGIDVDGPGGQALLDEICGINQLPETWQFTTGDGYRLLFAIPPGLKTKKYVKTDPENKHSECAILCDGQYSIMPTSKHVNGKRYAWVAGRSPDTIDCAMLPTYILDLIRADRPLVQQKIEKKVNDIVLNLEQENKPPFAEKVAAFTVVEFNAEMPEELLNAKYVAPKKKDDTEVADVPAKGWQLYLNGDVISEGGRDNAMVAFIGSLLSDATIRTGGLEVARIFIEKFNQTKLDPPLSVEEWEPKLINLWEKEQVKSAEFAEKAKEAAKLDHVIVGMAALNKLKEEGVTYIIDPLTSDGFYYLKGQGPWIRDVKNRVINNTIADVCRDEFNNEAWATINRLKETVYRLNRESHKGYEEVEQLFLDNHKDPLLYKYLPVDGKKLDWQTGEISPWTQDFMSVANIKVGYDPAAKCPHWEDYMSQWLPDPSYRQLLQEFLGCAMLSRPDEDGRFIILVGSGANGKSMCLNAIEALYGESMCCAQELKRLSEDTFGTAALFGKRVNICSELCDSGEYIKDTSMLKRLVTGDKITINQKYVAAFEYYPIASHIFSSNVIPKVKDKSDGWFRRQIIIPFEQTFKASSAVSAAMIRNIESERAGIFNWLLEGLRRKYARGHYIIPQKLQQTQDELRLDQDPIRKFASLFLRTSKVKLTTKNDAREFMAEQYSGATVHGTSATLIYGIFCLWFVREISGGERAKFTVASVSKKLKELYNCTPLTQCISVGRLKAKTSVLAGIDFHYSEEFLDLLEEAKDGNVLSSLDASTLQAVNELIKYNRMYLEEGKIRL